MENVNITEAITQTINSLFSNLFSSIDNSAYAILDDITFIGKDIINDKFTSNLLGTSTSTGIVLIANALIIGMSVYYATRYLFSNYMSTQVEKPFQFIFKALIISISIIFSFFISEQILNINYLLSGSILEVGEKILNTKISFEELIVKINSNITINGNLNVFSFDGMIKSFTSFGLFNLLFTYSLRYIMVKVFVLITPLMLVTLLNNSTSWIFKSWFKSVLSLLLVQVFVSIILLVIFSIDFSQNGILAKLIYIGSIYALSKANMFTRQILGGIATDISSGISGLKGLVK